MLPMDLFTIVNYHSGINRVSYEALYGRTCQIQIYWNEPIFYTKIVMTDLKSDKEYLIVIMAKVI